MIGKPEDRLIGTDIVTRLLDWVTIYPEDIHTPEGGLYLEAADEIRRLRAGGCARDQGTTQYCAEAAALAAENAKLREANELLLTDVRRTDVDMREMLAENKRLRAALKWFADAYDKAAFIAAAYVHEPECRCLRCAHDNARAALGGDT